MDDVAEVPEPGDVGEDAGIAEVRSALAVQSRDRAVRLARASRIVFGLGVATAVLLVVVWVLGAVGTSESGFRILALAGCHLLAQRCRLDAVEADDGGWLAMPDDTWNLYFTDLARKLAAWHRAHPEVDCAWRCVEAGNIPRPWSELAALVARGGDRG